jgi:hypothetical protein
MWRRRAETSNCLTDQLGGQTLLQCCNPIQTARWPKCQLPRDQPGEGNATVAQSWRGGAKFTAP